MIPIQHSDSQMVQSGYAKCGKITEGDQPTAEKAVSGDEIVSSAVGLISSLENVSALCGPINCFFY